jgi:hypothetical protein
MAEIDKSLVCATTQFILKVPISAILSMENSMFQQIHKDFSSVAEPVNSEEEEESLDEDFSGNSKILPLLL